MTTPFLAFLGMWETVALLAVVLILFGAKKLPELAKGLGKGIKEFRSATREVNEDLQRAFEEDDAPPPPRRPRPIPSKSESSPKAEPKTEAKTEA